MCPLRAKRPDLLKGKVKEKDATGRKAQTNIKTVNTTKVNKALYLNIKQFIFGACSVHFSSDNLIR